MTNVALLGLGLMGTGMATRLLDAGLSLSIYNRSPEKAASLVARGARLARTPGEAADSAQVILSMVADDDASRSVWLGTDGALAGAPDHAILIESSTLTPAWIRALAAAAAVRGCALLDAPVTGSRSHAATGELTFLVGGSDHALAVARPVLEVMSKAIVHVGPTGSGAILKLVNNFLCGVQAASLAEALALLERAGLDRELSLGVLTNGAPGSPLVKAVSQRMVHRDFAPHFHLGLMAKDLRYALLEGEHWESPLTTAQPAWNAFVRAAAAGLAQSDFAAVIEPLRVEPSPP